MTLSLFLTVFLILAGLALGEVVCRMFRRD